MVFDPQLLVSDRQLRCFEYSPSGYVEMVQPFFSLLGLGLTLWKGEYETYEATWLRWCHVDKTLLATGKESSLVEKARADKERARADEEKARADGEKARADEAAATNARLLERLRAAGLEPD